MMLIEIIRRTAHDWILYRSSTRLNQRQIAEEAYDWLFNEKPGTPQWVERSLNKKELTSLYGICDVLSLDPEAVRAYVRRLTVKEILSTGRPPTYRRQKENKVYSLPPKMEEVVIPVLVPLPPTPPPSLPRTVLLCSSRITSTVSPYVQGLIAHADSNRRRLIHLLQG